MSREKNYTHNFFPYPAKFPPEPIREFILRFSKENDIVLDPFCGSGTVLVEALLHKRNAVGIDLNPVSVLVSKAKSNIYSREDLSNLLSIIKQLEELLEVRDLWVYNTVSEKDLPNYKNRELWFKENMLYEMASIRKTFLYSDRYSSKLIDLLWMAFLKIVVDVSNQETDTRYASITKPELVDGYAIRKFIDTLREYYKVLSTTEFIEGISNVSVEVIEGDVNKNLDKIKDESMDLVITSPPYINTFDYYLYHKHRIFWLGKDPQEVRKKEIGCHHRIDTMSFERAFSEYKENMEKLIRALSFKLKKGKYFVMLIGDGIVKGELVKADNLVKDICSRNNFQIEEIITTPLRDVSKGFLKGRNLDKKKHHTIIMKRW
ncbi:DNA methyltransferase [Thermaerobacillus caldiproteolyticus]|uniref:DNA methyltransferase n=1 Tax=Thermaerobacillus caldiproteolyticus TaxID=247480 RepID=UPI0018F1B82D|nr:DNA methyltransferase [Anoxybacillus caldiproteolyticus]